MCGNSAAAPEGKSEWEELLMSEWEERLISIQNES